MGNINLDKVKGLDAYYEIAETYDLPMTKKVIEKQPMFAKSHGMDGIILGYLKFMNKLQKLKSRFS